MLKLTKIILLTLITLTVTMSATAQKYGHVNIGNLLTELPATKAADVEIIALQKQLMAEGEAKVKAFQADYVKFQEVAQGGTKSQMELQTWQEKLQKTQESIQQFSATSEQQIMTKRQQLLDPILTKVQQAIDSVAKANGYLMIFDVSTGAMMYAQESEDITALVKAKL